jgi:hypothetical protein
MLAQHMQGVRLLRPGQEQIVSALPEAHLAILQQIRTGWSGADVYIVDVHPIAEDDPKSLHILKLDARPAAKSETCRHETAWVSSLNPHMPCTVETTPPVEKTIATLYPRSLSRKELGSVGNSSPTLPVCPIYELTGVRITEVP